MRIAQISDFHFTHLTWNPLRLFSKRFLGNLNWLFFRKGHFSEKLLEPLPSFFQELGVDLVLVGGDLSTTSLAEEFQKGALFLKQLNLPWIAIPGNHDKYTYRSCRKQHFYRYFTNKRKEITDPIEFFTLQKHGVEVHKIGKGWYVVALDTTLATNPYSSEGIISRKLQDYLDEALQLIPEDASILMLNHYPFFQNDVSRHALKRGKSLQKQIERHPRIRLYLHGHTHRHTIANLQENNLPIVLDGGSCSAGKRASFNIIDLHPDRCEISAYFWQSGWTKTRTEEFLWTRN